MSEATASNSRPQDDVSMGFTRGAIMLRTSLRWLSGTSRQIANSGNSAAGPEGGRETPGPGPPGRAHRRIASRQRDVAQMRAAFESAVVRHQEFASPDLDDGDVAGGSPQPSERPVGRVAGAIQRHSDRLTAQSVLGHATGNVRVMVLHADLLQVRHA